MIKWNNASSTLDNKWSGWTKIDETYHWPHPFPPPKRCLCSGPMFLYIPAGSHYTCECGQVLTSPSIVSW